MRTASVDLYVDVLFFVNFLMDFLVLAIVKRIRRYKAGYLRLCAAAGAGALWAVIAAVCTGIPLWLQLIITYAGVSTLMVKLAFSLKKKQLLTGILFLYLVTFLAAGAMNAVYQYTEAGAYLELVLRGRIQEAMPGVSFLFLAAGVFFGGRFVLARFSQAGKGGSHLYEVTMRYRGREKTITALLDTGNRLYEPVTKRPVHVVTYEALRDICESVSSVIFIPFCSVGKDQGMMPGIFLDEIEIHQGDEIKKIERPLVAVCTSPLSQDGQYQMLLHDE